MIVCTLTFEKHWFSVLGGKNIKVVQNAEEFLKYSDQKTMTDRETRINCDPQELRRGLLQSKLQLEKEVEQNLAYFWTSKTDKKKCEGEKERK